MPDSCTTTTTPTTTPTTITTTTTILIPVVTTSVLFVVCCGLAIIIFFTWRRFYVSDVMWSRPNFSPGPNPVPLASEMKTQRVVMGQRSKLSHLSDTELKEFLIMKMLHQLWNPKKLD